MALKITKLGFAILLILISGCGAGKKSSNPAPTVVAISGVAQGPLVSGSIVTAHDVDASLTPLPGVALSAYKISTNLGVFTASGVPASTVELTATGNYFDSVLNATSTVPVTLKSYVTSGDISWNVNILTTLAYQRIKTRVNTGETFLVARQKAENEVLNIFHIRDVRDIDNNPINFGNLDLEKGGNINGSDGHNLLAAISSSFVFGSSYDQLNATLSNFQTDIANNDGCINSTAIKNLLIKNARGVDTSTVASNLTSKYSATNTQYLPTDISNWLDQDNDGVVGKYQFTVAQARWNELHSFPTYTVGKSDSGALYKLSDDPTSNDPNSTAIIKVASDNSYKTFKLEEPFPVKEGDKIFVSRTPSVSHGSSIAYLQSTLPNDPPCKMAINSKFKLKTNELNVARFEFNPFVPVARLTTARAEHTATLLQDGRVLVVGGMVSGTNISATATVELYTPATNQWTVAASMKNARAGHTATLLNGGQVLVVGGDGAKRTAEIYDPLTNTWVSVDPPKYGRTYHTATLLPKTGAVLIVGGIVTVTPATVPSSIHTAELYTPSTNVWTPAGSMINARYKHTATLLSSNSDTVIIAGGINTDLAISSVEQYTPQNTWQSLKNMTTASFSHSATRLEPSGDILVVGGLGTDGTALLRTEKFNPSTNIWTSTADLTTSRFAHIAQLLPDGQVLVVGGVSDEGALLSSAELFHQNTGTGAWIPNGNMAYARKSFASILLNNNQILLVGGQGVKEAEVFE